MEYMFIIMQLIPAVVLLVISYFLFFKTDGKSRYFALLTLAASAYFFYSVIASIVNDAEQANVDKEIEAHGEATYGYAYFVDKMWNYQVNGKPVNTIVKYRYEDANGNGYQGKSVISTDFAIEHNVITGTCLKVKYLPSEPSQSIVDGIASPGHCQKSNALSDKQEQMLLDEGITAMAKVVSLNSNQKTTSIAWEFTTNSNEHYKGGYDSLSTAYVNKENIRVGSEIPIKYLENDPTLNGMVLKDN